MKKQNTTARKSNSTIPSGPKGSPKKFYVYVRNEKGNVIKLGFGDPNMEIKRDDPERIKNFRSRHNCSDPNPKYKAVIGLVSSGRRARRSPILQSKVR